MSVTKSQMLEMIDSGKAFISDYCYMTRKVEVTGCDECHDYSCCIKNGTGDPGVSLMGLFNKEKNTLICDLEDIIDNN